MLLTVDIGNSTIVIAAYPNTNGERVRSTAVAPLANWRLPTERQGTEDRYGRLLCQLWAQSGFYAADFQDAALCSVVAPLTERWRRMLTELLGREPLVLHWRLDLGLTLAVEQPEQVGMDRIADAVAVYQRTALPHAAIAVDFGTATTFNVVDAEGRFCGGAIAPGLGTVAAALRERANALPAVELVPPATAIAPSTTPALQSGIVYGYTGLVEGLLARMRQELDSPVTVIATGGLGHIIAPLTDAFGGWAAPCSCHQAKRPRCRTDAFDPWLTLAGIRTIYHRNR